MLFVFSTPFTMTSFLATLDNSTNGDLDPASTAIKFYDDNNNLLYTAPVDQSVSGYALNLGPIGDVKTILLPGTAFYDNITVVPEPGSALSLVSGMMMLLSLRRRRG